MPAAFYGESSNQMISPFDVAMVSCKSCYGTGIVWEMEITTPPYNPYIKIIPSNPVNPPDEYPTISWCASADV